MVFQHFGLAVNRCVLDKLATVLFLSKAKKEQKWKPKQTEWLETSWIDWLSKTNIPSQLSGGQTSNASVLARALCTNAEILLMEKPFPALDPLTEAKMQDSSWNCRKT